MAARGVCRKRIDRKRKQRASERGVELRREGKSVRTARVCARDARKIDAALYCTLYAPHYMPRADSAWAISINFVISGHTHPSSHPLRKDLWGISKDLAFRFVSASKDAQGSHNNPSGSRAEGSHTSDLPRIPDS